MNVLACRHGLFRVPKIHIVANVGLDGDQFDRWIVEHFFFREPANTPVDFMDARLGFVWFADSDQLVLAHFANGLNFATGVTVADAVDGCSDSSLS